MEIFIRIIMVRTETKSSWAGVFDSNKVAIMGESFIPE
jgi:hypothetical protein